MFSVWLYDILHYAMLYSAILCYSVVHYMIRCCTISYYMMLSYSMAYYTIFHFSYSTIQFSHSPIYISSHGLQTQRRAGRRGRSRSKSRSPRPQPAQSAPATSKSQCLDLAHDLKIWEFSRIVGSCFLRAIFNSQLLLG